MSGIRAGYYSPPEYCLRVWKPLLRTTQFIMLLGLVAPLRGGGIPLKSVLHLIFSHLALQFLLIQELFRFGNDVLSQQQNGDEVRQSHKTVGDIGNGPYRLHRRLLGGVGEIHVGHNENVGCHQQNVQDSERLDAPHAEKVNHAPFRVEVPAQNGGEGEEHKTDVDDVGADGGAQGLGERQRGHGNAGFGGCPGSGDDQRDAGEHADHQGVQEGAGHVGQYHRVICITLLFKLLIVV